MLDSILNYFFDTEAERVIGGIAGGVILLGLVALAAALFKYAQVRRWPQAAGRVLGSSSGFALVQRFKTEAPRNRRVAKIAYEYEVAGKTFRSNRILDSGEPPEEQVDRLVADHPSGKAVTVFYNPRDPAKAALMIEHPPKDLALGCLATCAIIAVMAWAAIWFIDGGVAIVQGWLPDAIIAPMIATAVFGVLFLALFFVFMRRAAAIARWPQATGQITLSKVEEFTIRRDKPLRTSRGLRRMRQSFMPVVEYSYEVGGRDYASRSIWPGTEVSGDRDYASRIAARYPVGKVVFVFYNPADPKQAGLETGTRMHWFLLFGAVVFFAAAVALSRMLF
ncbi:MAG: DUF3592 domain-containing protein [Rhizobiaceae bacterium]